MSAPEADSEAGSNTATAWPIALVIVLLPSVLSIAGDGPDSSPRSLTSVYRYEVACRFCVEAAGPVPETVKLSTLMMIQSGYDSFGSKVPTPAPLPAIGMPACVDVKAVVPPILAVNTIVPLVVAPVTGLIAAVMCAHCLDSLHPGDVRSLSTRPVRLAPPWTSRAARSGP